MNGNDYLEIIEENITEIEAEYIEINRTDFDNFAQAWAEDYEQSEADYKYEMEKDRRMEETK